MKENEKIFPTTFSVPTILRFLGHQLFKLLSSWCQSSLHQVLLAVCSLSFVDADLPSINMAYVSARHIWEKCIATWWAITRLLTLITALTANQIKKSNKSRRPSVLAQRNDTGVSQQHGCCEFKSSRDFPSGRT